MVIADLVLCELLQGARSARHSEVIHHQFRTTPLVSCGGGDLAVAAAAHFRTLRSHGITPRNTVDCLIASLCIREGYALLHRDREYEAFEKHLGLRVIHP
jgi:predicted nucleic acid-binding protein